MKKDGSKSDFCIRRNKEILRIYLLLRKELIKYGMLSNMDICHLIARMPARRFFLSFDAARAAIYDIPQINRTNFAFSYRRTLLCCFRTRYFALKNKYQGLDVSKKEIIWEALESPAPCLGISPARIRSILYEGGLK